MQHSPSTNPLLGNVSASMIDVDPLLGACQITSVTIDNVANAHEGWLHIHDSHDTSVAATGSTSALKIFCPALAERTKDSNGTGGADADGVWSFNSGITINFVRGESDSNNQAPDHGVKVYIQTRP